MNKILPTILALIFSFFGCLIHNSVSAVKLQAGDIVMYKGAFKHIVDNNIVEHVGIYTGQKENTVIEFTTLGKESPKVINTPLKTFKGYSSDGKIYRIDVKRQFPDLQPLAPEAVVACAKDFLKDGGQNFGQYDPLSRNCQHFVTHCKFGQQMSWQVDGFISSIHRILPGKSTSLIVEAARDISKIISGHSF